MEADVRMLLVDDSEMDLVTTARCIRALDPDVQIDEAHSGAEAVGKMRDRHYDAVVTDVFMAGVNGLLVAQYAGNAGVPKVVLISGTPLPLRVAVPFVEKQMDVGRYARDLRAALEAPVVSTPEAVGV